VAGLTREVLMADHGAIVSEVEAAYRHYIEAFNSRDPKEIARLYDRPHAQVAGETGMSIINDDADQQAWYEFVMAYLDDQGWDHNEVEEMWVWPLSATLAQLVATSTRYRKDGSVLQRVRANYTLRRRDGTWKVVLSFPVLEGDFDVPVLPPAFG
jgi:ketosteroid isomerase-like protein